MKFIDSPVIELLVGDTVLSLPKQRFHACRNLRMAAAAASPINSMNPPFDFVIAADVVYIEESVPEFVYAMESLLSDDGVSMRKLMFIY
ncbi:protein-lysine methyltransferase METTL21D-like [Trifolium medium]|uniref:Protein-lysine methyltransferase METTL21D-like n=1 Tax=Trifolium medium TaxID=97028 RepID=A0A392P3W5_9FABA|nr:protein-lysine methyltransferase METTL21D-like [Trifolium medium]